ncbi:MAG: NAD(P)-dependent glycerol-3-phosphate dehydrogenase [Deltaproteobacteria bacterium]|nr:MAG: NAD(P)-dependent glycerol-3-phosphate dehydrogenase [Deltaproteobacteria bacterium]
MCDNPGAVSRKRPIASATVLGAGSWGTALAIQLARAGLRVRLWARDPAHAGRMRAEGRNPRYLPKHPFAGQIEPVDEDALAATGPEPDLVVAAVPTHALRATLARLGPQVLGPGAGLLLACKGVEPDTLETMAEVALAATEGLGADRVLVLGGPSFAAEVAAGLPTAVVVACRDVERARRVQNAISAGRFRAYVTDDVVGVELGGAFKNVIALAAGLCDGAGLGQNARAALITRGLAEITRLGVHMGAHPATLAGLAGVGDLVLTCTGGLSRNRRVGMALGRGASLEEALAEVGQVAEGVRTTTAAYRLARREGVEMPICETMHAILYEGLSVEGAVERLMGRSLRTERDPQP